MAKLLPDALNASHYRFPARGHSYIEIPHAAFHSHGERARDAGGRGDAATTPWREHTVHPGEPNEPEPGGGLGTRMSDAPRPRAPKSARLPWAPAQRGLGLGVRSGAPGPAPDPLLRPQPGPPSWAFSTTRCTSTSATSGPRAPRESLGVGGPCAGRRGGRPRGRPVTGTCNSVSESSPALGFSEPRGSAGRADRAGVRDIGWVTMSTPPGTV